MSSTLEKLEAQLANQDKLPPVSSWQPDLSGEIDIEIRRNGEWWHEGSVIRRKELVKLFASILRREEDGHHYLVTPVEKWRIRVEDVPLLIVDFEIKHPGESKQSVIVVSNMERHYILGNDYPMSVQTTDKEDDLSTVPVVELDNGLLARFDRPVYYRLVDIAEQEGDKLTLISEGRKFIIGSL